MANRAKIVKKAAQVGIRMTAEMKEEVLKSLEANGNKQSITEWVEDAIARKLQTEARKPKTAKIYIGATGLVNLGITKPLASPTLANGTKEIK